MDIGKQLLKKYRGDNIYFIENVFPTRAILHLVSEHVHGSDAIVRRLHYRLTLVRRLHYRLTLVR